MNKKHLWQGTWLSDKEMYYKLDNLSQFTLPAVSKQFPLEYLLDKMQQFHELLKGKGKVYESFIQKAMLIHSSDRKKTEAMLNSMIEFISKKNLEQKLFKELGSINPFAIKRPSMKEDHFEGWLPLGVLVHIAPTNVFAVPVMCIIEGLLSGNINILKTSSTQHQLPQLFFEAFLSLDTKELLKPYIIILEFSSKEKELLQQIINSADVVSAWGGENAINNLRKMTPQGVRFVEWGHKISFAYFSKESMKDIEEIRKVCQDVCLLDQNACSSPQDVFIETDNFPDLVKFAETFSEILNKTSKNHPGETPPPPAQAEISTVISIAQTEEALGFTKVFRSEDYTWSVIADKRPGLSISPLFRTVIIKPLLRENIISTLHPMKRYLQTVSLSAPYEQIISLAQKFYAAGCLRIRNAGSMHDNYLGEPHDGVYALPQFMKRVSITMQDKLAGISNFRHFETSYQKIFPDAPVMNKEDFQSMKIDSKYADLTFTSGGSSGKTTYSYFTYKDYHIHMQAAAEGLFTAGLNPKTDKVINLFAAGHLYGGFLSFFTILEKLEAIQYPMGLVDDLTEAGKLIVEKRINTIISIPTFIMKLFRDNETLFKKQKIVKKIFFGGDHFPNEQMQYLKEVFGVELIRAAAYGSNDAGVLGYQCPHCRVNEYHLLSALHTLEVFELDKNCIAEKEKNGRLVFTSKHRNGQNIIRYDLGDTGFINNESCKCGRKDPKFTLQGRSSDAFKAGGPFLNYNIFKTLLTEIFNYSGLCQILLINEGNRQKLILKIEKSIQNPSANIAEELIRNYEYLRLSVEDLGLIFEIEKLDPNKFECVKNSGKIRHIIDKRRN
jgi:phenylacetate-coenzyme A ligase PaaK-like adenylate-forming protein